MSRFASHGIAKTDRRLPHVPVLARSGAAIAAAMPATRLASRGADCSVNIHADAAVERVSRAFPVPLVATGDFRFVCGAISTFTSSLVSVIPDRGPTQAEVRSSRPWICDEMALVVAFAEARRMAGGTTGKSRAARSSTPASGHCFSAHGNERSSASHQWRGRSAPYICTFRSGKGPPWPSVYPIDCLGTIHGAPSYDSPPGQ
jgi:hypothetical protein